MAIEQIPDLIISDVMMPRKDGYELCKTLKSDPRTCHIPIILLTAKASFEDRMTGWEQGADAYLAKPFADRELQIRIEKLLALRETLREKFSSELWETQVAKQSPSANDEFLKRVCQTIQENLAAEALGPDFLTEKLFVSRTQLHRKLKAITGFSTSELINRMRIEEAKKLLRETNDTIEQIAYLTGYNNTSYFRRTFNKIVQTTPSAYRQQL